MDKKSPGARVTWPQILVILAGLIVFVLLIVADKTHLDNDPQTPLKTMAEGGENHVGGEAGTDPDKLRMQLDPIQGNDSLTAMMQQADATDPSASPDLYRGLVTGLQHAGRLDFAAIYAAKLAVKQPETKNLLVAGALSRNAAAKYRAAQDTALASSFTDLAVDMLNLAIETDPENEDVLIELGLSYVESGRAEWSMQGIQTLLKVLEINPQNAEAAFNLGVFSLNTGQYDKAEQRFRTVLEILPQHAEARFYLIVALKEQGKADEAKAEMEKLKADPDAGFWAEEAERMLN